MKSLSQRDICTPMFIAELLTVIKNYVMGLPRWLSGKETVCQCRRCKRCVLLVKNPTCQCRSHRRHGFKPWVGKIPCTLPWLESNNALPLATHLET